MTTGNKKCETNLCAACNCICNTGHKCTECNTCTQEDDHTRSD